MSFSNNNYKVLIASASPKSYNNNADILSYVYKGFVELLGDNNVEVSDYLDINDLFDYRKFDLVLIFGSCMPSICDYSQISYLCKKSTTKLAFWMHDDPYELDHKIKIEKYADIIFTNDKWSAVHYDHSTVYHLPLAAIADIHYRKINQKPIFDLFFCGVGFPNRIRIFEDLRDIVLDSNAKIYLPDCPNLSEFTISKRLSNEELPYFYSSAAVTLNIGRDFNLANDKYSLAPSTPGPRTFEAAMAGALQFFWAESLEILEYFNEDEIIIVNNKNEFAEKFKYYINNPDEAFIIKNKSQQKCMNYHQYKNRASFIMQKVFN